MALNLLDKMTLNAWVGFYSSDGNATSAVQSLNVDSLATGASDPQPGMMFFHTIEKVLKLWDDGVGSWQGVSQANVTRVNAGAWVGLLAGKADVQASLDALNVHTHLAAQITDFATAAQDAVGAALADTTTVAFTYLANTITADVKPLSIDASHLANGIDASGKGFNAAQVLGSAPNDSGAAVNDLWSAQKIANEIAAAVSGLKPLPAVRMATTQPLASEPYASTAPGVVYSAGGGTITQFDATDGVFGGVDGVVTGLAAGQKILVQHPSPDGMVGTYEITALGDGIATPWVLTRVDLLNGDSAQGRYVPVEEGTENDNNFFICVSDSGSDVVGTDALEFKPFGSVTDHNTLQGLQGGNGGGTEMYHLDLPQHTALTTGADAGAQHNHDSQYFTETELGSVAPGSEGASLIGTDAKVNLGNATDVEAALTSIDTQIILSIPLNGIALDPVVAAIVPRFIGDKYICTAVGGVTWESRGVTSADWYAQGLVPLNGAAQSPIVAGTIPRYIGDKYVCTAVGGLIWESHGLLSSDWKVH